MTHIDNVPGDAIDVMLQDQTSPIIDRFLTRKLATITLAAPTVIDSRTIELSPGHGFVGVGMIEITEGINLYQSRVISVATNTITVTNPLPIVFTTAAFVQRVSPDANIVGSAISPVIFSAQPPAGLQWDINILAINILDQSPMDDSLFGGIPALTNGVMFRTVDGLTSNIFNATDNSCFVRHCDVENPYSDKAPAGFYGFNTKRRFNGQQGDGVSRRLGGDGFGEFQAVVADDLTALDRFWIVIRGHVVED